MTDTKADYDDRDSSMGRVFMEVESPMLRTVGLEVVCHHSDARPSATHRPPVQHPYTVRVDLLSVNATVFGYGDTPAEAFYAARELMPPLWRGAVEASELPIMHEITVQLLDGESGRFKAVTSAPVWCVQEWAYEWPREPMKDFNHQED